MKNRPAETAGLAGAAALLLAIVLGVEDVRVIGALVVVLGALPAGVTLIVANGGIVGAFRRLLFGVR